MTTSSGEYDIIIIGGGINGAGIARDAALRGLRVLLLEQYDFGSGTTSWSTRLIHGGLRYLEHGEISLVYESLHERRRLLDLAPHLIQQLRIAIPIYKGSRRGMLLLRLGMALYDLLSIGKKLPRHTMLDRDEFLAREPGINPQNLRGGAEYFDAQVTYAERLVIENVLAAARAGASVRNYSPVVRIATAGNRVCSVHYVDYASGRETQANAPVVINAAGPWVDQVLATADQPMERLMGGTKGSHIVVGRFPGAPRSALYVEAAADGRPVFIIPWNGQYLIGTTDIRYEGDPGGATASAAEVQYLLAETNRVIPGANLTATSIHFAYAGIRPLPWHEQGPESAITRRHIICKHAAPAAGLISVIGGKLTTYRNLAEQVTNIAMRKIGAHGDCRTRAEPLPGGAGIDGARAALSRYPKYSDTARERLLGIYGACASNVLKLAMQDGELAKPLDANGNIIGAEVAYAIRHEFARNLADILHRRSMIGLKPDLGKSLAHKVAMIAARELKWDESAIQQQLADLQKYESQFRIAS